MLQIGQDAVLYIHKLVLSSLHSYVKMIIMWKQTSLYSVSSKGHS